MIFFNYRYMVLISLLLTVGINSSFSQNNNKKSRKEKANKDIQNVEPLPDASKPQTYEKVITADAIAFKGVFTVFKINDNYYFELPDSILGLDFQVISRIGKGPAVLHRSPDGFAGKILGNTQIRFSKGSNDKLYINRVQYGEVADDNSENGLHKALQVNSVQSIISSFDIKSYGKNSVVIDVTDYLKGDLNIITGKIKEIFSGTSFQADRSYINTVNAFATNVDIEMIKTYEDNQTSVTTQINTNFILLPKDVMPVRYGDPRVGFDSQLRTDFDQDTQRGKKVEFINRWRLEPKPEDRERYEKGELVEPIKPIVFNIDPATPKKWIPYIIKAVNNWQTAFEKAGFKNAIYAKETAVGDSSWNSKEGRLNTIIYAPTMSSGITHHLVTDPRSGEIIQATIQINHNTLNVLRNTYMSQIGAIDPRARTNEFSTELMGELLEVVLSGHIGSALGLLDNAGAASTVPIAKLRDKQWVAKHGISPSIMQNVLFNFVAQPEDNMTKNEIYGRIGDYDKFAIYFGYKYFPKIANPLLERDHLREIIADSLKTSPQLYYGAAPKENEIVSDPRNQSFFLGNNAIEAAKLGIKNLKIVAVNLIEWTKNPDELYSYNGGRLGRMAGDLIDQYHNYLKSVANIFGTYYYNPHGKETAAEVYKPVSLDMQKKSMAFLKTELFDKTPDWILPENIASLMIDLPYSNNLYYVGTELLTKNLLDFKRLKNIHTIAESFGADQSYTLVSYLKDLDSCIWAELGTSKKVSSYHMVLQKMYLNALSTVVDTPRDLASVSVVALTRGHLIELKQKTAISLKLIVDKTSKDHYTDVLQEITKLIDPKRPVPVPIEAQNPNAQKKINDGINIRKENQCNFTL